MQQAPYTVVKSNEFSAELFTLIDNVVSEFRKAFDEYPKSDPAYVEMGDDLNVAASLVDTILYAIIQSLVKQGVDLKMGDIQAAFNSIWNTLKIETAAAQYGGMN